jgi:hypothetical protein
MHAQHDVIWPAQVKIALCQMATTDDKQKNIQTARSAVKVCINILATLHVPAMSLAWVLSIA